jgi:hypothetical protein
MASRTHGCITTWRIHELRTKIDRRVCTQNNQEILQMSVVVEKECETIGDG